MGNDMAEQKFFRETILRYKQSVITASISLFFGIFFGVISPEWLRKLLQIVAQICAMMAELSMVLAYLDIESAAVKLDREIMSFLGFMVLFCLSCVFVVVLSMVEGLYAWLQALFSAASMLILMLLPVFKHIRQAAKGGSEDET